MATKKKSTSKKKSPTALRPYQKEAIKQIKAAARKPNKREQEQAEKARQQTAQEQQEASALQLARQLLKMDAGEYKLVVRDAQFFSPRSYYILEGDKLSNCDKAARNQPHFTLLATDNLTPNTVREWIRLAEDNGVPHEKTKDAREVLKRIEQYRTENPLLCAFPS